MTETSQKPIWKKVRFRVIVFFAFIILHWIYASMTNDGTTSSYTSTTTQAPEEEKIDGLQERINTINELYKEEPTFEKVEKIDDGVIAISFNDVPDLWVNDSVDFLARWQAVELSKAINGVGSVKIYVGGEAQEYCIATKWEISSCMDYR